MTNATSAERAPHQGGEEHAASNEADGDRDRQVAIAGCAAERGLRPARRCGGPPRRRPVCAGGRRGMPDGSVPIVIRPARGPRLGSTGRAVVIAVVRRGHGGRRGPAVGRRARRRVDRLVVLPHRRLGGERRPHVELVVGAVGRDGDVRSASSRCGGTSPVGGSVQCGSDPGVAGPNVRPSRSSTASSSRVGSCSPNSGPSLLVVRSRSPDVVGHRLSFRQSSPRSCTTFVSSCCRRSYLEQFLFFAPERARRSARRARG